MSDAGIDSGELDRWVKKLNDAKAISEWHFRDAVEGLLEMCVARAQWEDDW